jgi:CRP-like cAMP-binding protein
VPHQKHVAPSGTAAKPHRDLDVTRNRLLASCPEECLRQISVYGAAIAVRPGEALFDLGESPRFVYFPVNFTVTLINALPSGHTAQLAVVGCEGIVGIGSVLGGRSIATRALVQTAGEGVRVEAARVREEFERGGALNRVLVKYTQALIAQISQTAICARHHSTEQQLYRWLLLTLDRAHSSDLMITHEMIGKMLGLRRETVTETLRKFEARGQISNKRKHLQVLDRASLEAAACSCYRIIEEEYALLLPSAAGSRD